MLNQQHNNRRRQISHESVEYSGVSLWNPMCLNPLGIVPRILRIDFLARPRFASQEIRVYSRIVNTVLSVDR